eukprot:PhF_6_TR38574/c2_g3_i1/m.57278
MKMIATIKILTANGQKPLGNVTNDPVCLPTPQSVTCRPHHCASSIVTTLVSALFPLVNCCPPTTSSQESKALATVTWLTNVDTQVLRLQLLPTLLLATSSL